MEEKKKSSTSIIVVLVLIIIGLGGFIAYDKLLAKDNSATTNTQANESLNNNEKKEETIEATKTDNANIKSEIQRIYEAAYDAIGEGSNLMENEVTIKVGEEGTVGGVIETKASKVDFTKIEKYFTDRALNIMKVYYTDTPYSHKDGNYYIFTTENKYSYDKKEFIGTIFGMTDQGKRDLIIVSVTNDIVVAKSEKKSFIKEDEYIIFKKINDTWKIDMFEEF